MNVSRPKAPNWCLSGDEMCLSGEKWFLPGANMGYKDGVDTEYREAHKRAYMVPSRRKNGAYSAQIGARTAQIGAYSAQIGAYSAMDPIQKSRKNQSEIGVPILIIKLCKALYSFIKKARTFPPFAAAGTALTYNEGSTPRKEAREQTKKIFPKNRVKHFGRRGRGDGPGSL